MNICRVLVKLEIVQVKPAEPPSCFRVVGDDKRWAQQPTGTPEFVGHVERTRSHKEMPGGSRQTHKH